MSTSSSPIFPVPPNVRRAFDDGLAAGLDAATAQRDDNDSGAPPVLATTVTTTLRSRWLHRVCPLCGHTFRPGDLVQTAPGQDAVHDMPGLRCASLADGGALAVEVSALGNATFFEGLAAAWPMPDDVKIVRLEGDHRLLAPPRGAIRRRSCRVCGHSFRPMDHVVLCPCSLVDASKQPCEIAVHRDLLRQMHCWDQWLQGIEGEKKYSCLGFS